MAKSLRSKAKRRLRTVRREHQWETRGKHDMQAIASRLHNPFYDLRTDCNIVYHPNCLVQRKVNAFVEPANPAAVFPQIAKPDIFDFRSHKMENGGYAAMHTFRKARSVNAIKSKYPTFVKTREELDAEANAPAKEDMIVEVEEVKEVKKPASKSYTIDDIMHLDKSLQITKKKQQLQEASKGIKKDPRKKKHAKRSQKIVKF
jgi:hypothetical protein